MNPKFIALLGSTGSIGRSTLSLVRQFPDRFKIHSLSCRRSIDKLVDQIKEFSPKQVVVEASDQVTQLRELFAESELEILSGDQGNCQLVQHPEVDLVVTGIVGSAGLSPCLKALEYGKDFYSKKWLVLLMKWQCCLYPTRMLIKKLRLLKKIYKKLLVRQR